MQLLYLSPLPWSSFSQRPHKFVEWFRKVHGSEVLWIDPYPTRFPHLSDFRRITLTGSSAKNSSPPWLRVLHPKALPIEPFPASGLLNILFWNSLLKKISVFTEREETLLCIGKPSVLALIIVRRWNFILSLYDAMDDFPAFYSSFSRLAMKLREQQVVSYVTNVLASSTALRNRLCRIRDDVQLVPNGLDARVIPDPKTIDSKCAKTVFGYVGTIGPWFDWDWLVALAKARPFDVVRLIGPAFVPIPHKTLPENVEIYPSCNHEDALLAMQNFKIGLIPFKNNELTKSVDPIKYYEYRALGLPVITTDFGEMSYRGREEGVYLCRNKEDLGQQIELALAYMFNEESTRRFVCDNTWEARFSRANIY